MKKIIFVFILCLEFSSQATTRYTDNTVKKAGCKFELENRKDNSVESLILPPDTLQSRQVLITTETYFNFPPQGGKYNKIIVDKAAWVTQIGDCQDYDLAEFDDISGAWVTDELIRKVE